MTARKVIVTGASGWLGAEICSQLSRSGADVIGISRTKPRAGIPWIQTDISDFSSVSNAIRHADALIHAAGLAHQFRGARQDALEKANVIGTENVIRAAANAGTPRLVITSSMAVYAPSEEPLDEQSPTMPISVYGKTKLNAEMSAANIASASNCQLKILRLATLYGPGDRGNVARLMRRIDRRRFFWIGTGENSKSLIHVSDAARACIVAASLPTSRTVYNVAGGAYRMLSIVEALSFALGRKPLPFSVPEAVAYKAASVLQLTGRVGRTQADTLRKWLSNDILDGSRFAVEAHFRPYRDLREGIAEEVQWYRSQVT